MSKHEDEARAIVTEWMIEADAHPQSIMHWCCKDGLPSLRAKISTALAARDAEIERLTERCAIYEGHNKTYRNHIKVSSAVIGELRAQVERMRETAQPFAKAVADYESHRAEYPRVFNPAIHLRVTDDEIRALAATAKEPSMKPHKGKIREWFKLPNAHGLGYLIVGVSDGPRSLMAARSGHHGSRNMTRLLVRSKHATVDIH